jgi:hypothetical protein
LGCLLVVLQSMPRGCVCVCVRGPGTPKEHNHKAGGCVAASASLPLSSARRRCPPTKPAQVWPGPSVYPDYLANPNVTLWLREQLQAFYDQVPYDGLWLDMNEASNFCSGVRCRPDHRDRQKLYCEWQGRAGAAASSGRWVTTPMQHEPAAGACASLRA